MEERTINKAVILNNGWAFLQGFDKGRYGELSFATNLYREEEEEFQYWQEGFELGLRNRLGVKA